ncbi:hypothetical protein AAIR98_000863 [Elusimicrobium simillimum]|uniref:hypothetical protein n=1 Tax=Elusimicrobium simillimum TaxID=3143438 RepID=UPI003C6F07BF
MEKRYVIVEIDFIDDAMVFLNSIYPCLPPRGVRIGTDIYNKLKELRQKAKTLPEMSIKGGEAIQNELGPISYRDIGVDDIARLALLPLIPQEEK